MEKHGASSSGDVATFGGETLPLSEEPSSSDFPVDGEWDSVFQPTLNWMREEDGADRVNEYRIGRRLGKGSFGEVFECERCVGDPPYRKFAMKIMSKFRLRKLHEYVNTGGAMKKVTAEDKVRREIDIMRHLYHRNVVILFETIEDTEEAGDDSHICLVLELMSRGPTMTYDEEEGCFRAAECDVLSESDARLWFRDLLNGLKYLQSRGIAHRDIKPDNLLIFENGTLRISDFGCAVRFPQGPARAAGTLTNTAGTFTFFSPEGVSGEPFNGYGADLWAAAVTLYCWVFGALPFWREGMEPLFEAIRTQPVEVGDAVSDELAGLLLGLFHKNPARRLTLEQALEHPWLAEAVADAAAEAAEGLEETTSEEELDPPPPEPPSF
ncbi:unnamed protein product [Phaeothamnion confervicola]